MTTTNDGRRTRTVTDQRGGTVKVNVSHEGREVLAVIDGEVDADNCETLGAHIEPALDDQVDTLVLDASRLTFIDSSGITELLRLRDLMQERGGVCRIQDPTEQVRRILEITGLGDAFAVK
jgi:anti-sigma B factor antagonist